jgi:hypothetical protein
MVDTCRNPAATLDDASAEWITALNGTGAMREAGLARLHGLLVRVAVRELRRRDAGAWILGRELDDLAHQAADDAMLAILGKLHSFRGESRFTTWAHRFAVLDVSGKCDATAGGGIRPSTLKRKTGTGCRPRPGPAPGRMTSTRSW